jgi:hypothetical protein
VLHVRAWGTRVAGIVAEARMAEPKNDDQLDDSKDLGRVTGETTNATASNIGRGGDTLVQDDIAYGTDVDRAGTKEERERIREDRKAP